jgi:hypothetical protein
VRNTWKNATTFLSQVLDYLERERTAVRPRKPQYGPLWLGIPVFSGLWMLLFRSENVRHFWDTAGAGVLYLVFFSTMIISCLGCEIYRKHVSIKRQIVVDLIAWSVLIWMCFHFKLWAI